MTVGKELEVTNQASRSITLHTVQVADARMLTLHSYGGAAALRILCDPNPSLLGGIHPILIAGLHLISRGVQIEAALASRLGSQLECTRYCTSAPTIH